MATSPHTCPSSAHVQAGIVLQAWVCGDVDGLEAALDHIATSRVLPIDRTENKRLTLLKVIAKELKVCSNRYEPVNSNPVLGLYVDLLTFLCNGPSPYREQYSEELPRVDYISHH